jgi:hypothetical protein
MSIDSSDDPTVTFKHFRECREKSSDLAKAVGVAPWRDVPVSGFVYWGGLFWIEDTRSWSGSEPKPGRYCLLIDYPGEKRVERFSDDLKSLERRLYRFAAWRGVFDPADPDSLGPPCW